MCSCQISALFLITNGEPGRGAMALQTCMDMCTFPCQVRWGWERGNGFADKRIFVCSWCTDLSSVYVSKYINSHKMSRPLHLDILSLAPYMWILQFLHQLSNTSLGKQFTYDWVSMSTTLMSNNASNWWNQQTLWVARYALKAELFSYRKASLITGSCLTCYHIRAYRSPNTSIFPIVLEVAEV